MKTVYLVWTGEYSDSRVEAVFSTKEKAEEYCRYHNPKQEDGHKTEGVHPKGHKFRYVPDWYIDERSVDEEGVPEIPKGYTPFRAFVRKEDAYVKTALVSFCTYENHKTTYEFIPPKSYTWYDHTTEFKNQEYVAMVVLARDEQHATKIAAERRAWLLALNCWPDHDGNSIHTVKLSEPPECDQ